MMVNDVSGIGGVLIRVIDCLEKGISSIVAPYVFKRMERAKLLIEKERSEQSAIIALKESMTQDMTESARTTRDRNELHNIAEIYGGVIDELKNFDPSKLPSQLPSNEWAAHFYDCAKDCSDDEIRIIWKQILMGEIKSPGKYFKRTLTNLKHIEKHEADWFVNLCKFTLDDCYFPYFVLSDSLFPVEQYQSLVDCGFVNAMDCKLKISGGTILRFKGNRIEIKPNNESYDMRVITLTDTGMQICELVNVEVDDIFVNSLVKKINDSKEATASIVVEKGHG